jgi:MFS family permease
LIFFLVGWVYAAWATRIPAIKHDLGLSDGELGLAVLGLEGGAIVGLPTGGALVARAGSRQALRIGFAIYPAALVAVALAPGLATLAASLAVMAAGSSVADVGMNAQGVELERRYERPILSGLHAGHPLGLVAGGVAGTAAAAAEISVRAHFAAAAAVGLVTALAATMVLLREPARDEQPAFVRPSGRLLLLGLIAFCAFLLDGAAYNWSAVHVRSAHAVSAGLAATAFTLFSLTLAVGRLFGDRLVARFGRIRARRGRPHAEGERSYKPAAPSPPPAASWQSRRPPPRRASQAGRCSGSGSPHWPQPCSAPPRAPAAPHQASRSPPSPRSATSAPSPAHPQSAHSPRSAACPPRWDCSSPSAH